MTLPRFVLPDSITPSENLVLSLSTPQARHLSVLRLGVGDPLEILLSADSNRAWRGELINISKHEASIRLVAPIDEAREAPIEIHACLPITAQLGLWDDFLPCTVELGATTIQPIIYERSQYDARSVNTRMERWRRIILTACEQSHRTRIPELRPAIHLELLQHLETKQRWVAYEVATQEANPTLELENFAFTHGPEGGIADGEIELLRKSGWKPVSLGKSILRSSTCPAAILGAVQVELGRIKPLPS